MVPSRDIKIEAAERTLDDFETTIFEPIDQARQLPKMRMHAAFVDVAGILAERSFRVAESDEEVENARMKARISWRTDKSLYDVLKSYRWLLEPNERELVKKRGVFRRHSKLHAGGVSIRNTGIGVSGRGTTADCDYASWLSSRYEYHLNRIIDERSQAAQPMLAITSA